MKTHHITLSSDQRRTLTRGDQEARAAVRALARPSRERLLLFAVVDDHIHLVVRVGRPRILARDVVRSLQLALPSAVIQAPHVRAVESRAHHQWLVAQACLQAGFRPAALAPFLGVTGRSVRRLARRPLDPRALPALRRRLSLETRAQAA